VVIRKVLGGEPGPARDIVILNAAAGLLATGRATDPKSAASLAAEAIDSGAAERLLAQLATRSHQPA
jgi:anthranilate phosphoribosyltransferase